MNRGILITFEGIDGSGKSFIQKMVYNWLIDEGYQTLSTIEPGGSQFGKTFRQILLINNQEKLDSHTEALLFMVDRSFHVDKVILPALAQGKIVLSDRYIDSTLAYQGGGRGLDLERLRLLNNFAIKEAYPDLTLFLSVTIEKALSRQNERKDRLEQEDMDFFQRVINTYEMLFTMEPERIKKIDGSGNANQVFKLVQPLILQIIEAKGNRLNV